ncbi:hypothetical protein BRC68_01440 [Halobacteriales archaeon QH_6_64_20]|nr:MAG: hypothetical protein BRC68_01440 [Halobacteriales archaeon QH_6_64_20]
MFQRDNESKRVNRDRRAPRRRPVGSGPVEPGPAGVGTADHPTGTDRTKRHAPDTERCGGT